MIPFWDFEPSGLDSRENYIDLHDVDRDDWLVLASCSRSRDSDIKTESNFHVALKMLGGEGEDVEVHQFTHWACGWYELILIRPGSEAEKKGEQIEQDLRFDSELDSDDISRREIEEANDRWAKWYSTEERIEYIRENRHEFRFDDFKDLIAQVRGKYFGGDVHSLCS